MEPAPVLRQPLPGVRLGLLAEESVTGGAGVHLEARVPDGYLYSNDHGPVEPVDGPGTDWMWELALHYERMRRAYPDQQLCIVFDIDGTILDLRHLVVHALLGYDREHGSEYFHGLRAEDVSVHENRIDEFLRGLALPASVRAAVMAWYDEHLWSPRGSWRRTSRTGEFSV